MTVGDLIIELKKYPTDMLVVVDGYEDGFAEEIHVIQVFLKKNFNGKSDGIYGRHGSQWPANKPNKNSDLAALFIGEGRHLRTEEFDD